MSPTPRTRAAVTGKPEEVMSDKELKRAGQNGEGSEVAIPVPDFSSEDLQNLKNWEDLDAFTSKYGIDSLVADQVLGDGFAILNDKSKLIGVPLFLIEWRQNKGENGSFTSMRVVARLDNGSMAKYIVNDGSTGIHKQLSEFTESRKVRSGLFVKNGFRVSEYDYEDEKTGEVRPAKTFYLDSSA